MNRDVRLALRRPRDVGGVIGDSLALYGRFFGTFLAIGAVVVIPVHLIVLGLGLEQLTSGYDPTPPVGEQLIQGAMTFLVVIPLLSAMVTIALLAGEKDELRGPAAPVMAGLEAFTQVFLAVLIATVGVVIGFFALIAPGVYLLVRWWFVPQAVVVDRRPNVAALTRSGDLVRGNWWRTLGTILLVNLLALVPAALLQLPLNAAADGADSQALALLGEALTWTVVGPWLAVAYTLMYFDLRARDEGIPAPEPPEVEPPQQQEPPLPPGLERPEAPPRDPSRR